MFSQQVHGGLYAQPWAFFGEIQVAAPLGFARRPILLADLARRR